MNITVEYWDKISYTSVNSEVKRLETWNGTKERIFKKFNKENRSLRYCSGSYYKFQDSTLQKEYRDWYKSLGESKRFEMFYGNGVVD